jgi:hypothetical protein
MISLRRKQLPSSKDELARAIDDALRRYVSKPGPIVDVRSRVFPYLDEIAINLDGAQFDSPPPAPPAAAGERKPAFEAALVRLSAQNISVRGVPANLQIEAHHVVLQKTDDANGEIILLPQKARDGHLTIAAVQLDLEEVLAKFVESQARPHGIAIEQVRLSIRERGPRSLAAEVRIQARKLLFRAKIDIYGQLDIDELFVARISQLKCKSTGAIGVRACSALQPHLERFEGKTFSFKSLPLGDTRLHDLRIAVTDTVEITIDFESAT